MPETTLRYVGDRLMQCKDIPDQLVLDAVTDREPGWCTQTTGRIWDAIEEQLGPVPWNLLLAKLRRLVARGLIEGCPCGCSGGFTILGKEEPARDAASDPRKEPLDLVAELRRGVAQWRSQYADGSHHRAALAAQQETVAYFRALLERHTSAVPPALRGPNWKA